MKKIVALSALIFALAASGVGAVSAQARTQNKSLTGKTVVITGASSGFGRGVAIELARRGANLVLAARRPDELALVAAACGANALVVPTDVSDAEAVARLESAATAKFGAIDVWINDAGVGAFGRFTDIPPADYKRMLDINLTGTINGSYYALRDFKKTGRGTLINVASMAGKLPVAYYAAYGAGKSAVVALNSALRAELGADGFDKIRVCTVNPIASETSFWTNAANYTGHRMEPRPSCKPEIVVDAIVDLVEHPRDEVNVGRVARRANALHKIAPKFVETQYGKMVKKRQIEGDGASKEKQDPTDGTLFRNLTLASSTPAPIAKSEMRVIDLTHVLRVGVPDFHNHDDAFKYKTVFTVAHDGYGDGAFSMPEHLGTHVDAPSHFSSGAVSIDQIPAEKLIRKAVVIDVRKEVAADSDYCLSLERVKEFEKDGAIEPGSLIFCLTGWGSRWEQPGAYRNADKRGVMHFPGFSAAAADYLIDNRSVAGLGIDTLSLDFGASTEYAVHHNALKKGIYMVENLANLEKLPARGSTIFVGPLPIKNGTGSPARILAVID